MIAQIWLPTNNLQPPDKILVTIEMGVPTTIAGPDLNNEYSLLHSLGVASNSDGESNLSTISNLLSEFLCLYKENNHSMDFTYLENSKPGIAVDIPRSKDFISFNKSERWFKMVRNNFQLHTQTQRPYHFGGKCPYIVYLISLFHFLCDFVCVAIEKELHVRLVKNSVETEAMWTESNLSITQAKIIFHHINWSFQSCRCPYCDLSYVKWKI